MNLLFLVFLTFVLLTADGTPENEANSQTQSCEGEVLLKRDHRGRPILNDQGNVIPLPAHDCSPHERLIEQDLAKQGLPHNSQPRQEIVHDPNADPFDLRPIPAQPRQRKP